ncbi:FadR/GntR family transcriptional regulator [Haoranjiania flava]|uniref:GntR family transcriptional regulator n=1 Tax=Haoranjiania flava TaxID=1856322 RepID=A0AAE3IP34_9BACT|nr:GntR family transcriptional regulator [Haoranjiania flava]MCU7693871.1 GntR family transcriptional regulator [Haoranjiania flava]
MKESIELNKISTKYMAEIVEVKLRDYFKLKQFKPGDSLPTEMEIAQSLGVSRNVVREALSRFKMLGMIETKKKKGMFMSNPDVLGALERVLDPVIIDTATLQDIFELRLVLEMGMADILFLRKKDKDIAELEEIAGKEELSDINFIIQNEIAFHGKLYEMTGNETLKRFQTMLLPIFDYVVRHEKERKKGTVSHKDLVEIMKHGDKNDFKEGMYKHLCPHFERVAKKDFFAD